MANDVLVGHLLQGTGSSLNEELTDLRGLPASMDFVDVLRAYIDAQCPRAWNRSEVDLQGTVRAGQIFIHQPSKLEFLTPLQPFG